MMISHAPCRVRLYSSAQPNPTMPYKLYKKRKPTEASQQQPIHSNSSHAHGELLGGDVRVHRGRIPDDGPPP